MAQNVFQINNLQCEYKPGKPVLRLHRLDIPAGRLVFLIGRSGIGKSTFIETLGLMNSTIAAHPGTSLLFSPGNGAAAIEMKDSWQLPNARLSDFRKQHFSFIFQNTNLMPNFSSGENMMVSLLIEGSDYAQAKKQVLAMMDRLSLAREIFDKKVTEISGGQRQRLAFVRAVTSDFTVLFGDEPTGNLDRSTSEELMAVLKDLIKDKGKTGIVVSHDLALASQFADLIIPLTVEQNPDGTEMGSVLPENIIHRCENDTWRDARGTLLPDTHSFLNRFLEV
ncbi:MAG: ABC transporter ATP-binding protein [Bacteroidota bacterium]